MLHIFLIMVLSALAGLVFSKKRVPRRFLSSATGVVILVMMLLIGLEMGSGRDMLGALGCIFQDALLLVVAVMSGTITMAWAVNKYVMKLSAEPASTTSKNRSHLFSFAILGAFLAGFLCGLFIKTDGGLDHLSMSALYLLMALVGFSLGSDRSALRALGSQNRKLIWLPVTTIVGSLGGVLLFSFFVDMRLADQLAIGSGFGYYSLSSVILGELRTAQIGVVALIVNVTRELLTVVFAPLLVRKFSPLALICCGGATTMDVTLPVIISNCGSRFMAMALFQGVVVDFSVPFLVTFFAELI